MANYDPDDDDRDCPRRLADLIRGTASTSPDAEDDPDDDSPRALARRIAQARGWTYRPR
jgi:hypothetical protein